MDREVRVSLSEAVRSAANPVLKGKSILEEEYRRGSGVGESSVSRSASFEMMRSLVVQAAYEVSDPESTGWLEAGMIDPELEDAREARWYRLTEGLSYVLKNVPETVFSREMKAGLIALEEEAVSEKRFLGAVREYIPGVGYAVSIRKRTSENQDSFRISGSRAGKRLTLGDGVGSETFSAIASHLCVRDMDGGEFSKAGVISISERMGSGMNRDEYRRHNGGALGTSTLLAAEIRGAAKRVLRVGDSIGFAAFEGVVLELAEENGLVHVVGYTGLEDGFIEEFGANESQLVLTSDGVTNYVNDFAYLLSKMTALTTNAVMIAERMVRAALSSQIRWDQADDLTIIVEDTG